MALQAYSFPYFIAMCAQFYFLNANHNKTPHEGFKLFCLCCRFVCFKKKKKKRKDGALFSTVAGSGFLDESA